MAKASEKIKPIIVFCRACHSRIRFDERPELYDIVTCPECEEAYEVVGLSPIQLDWSSDFDDDERATPKYKNDLYGKTHLPFPKTRRPVSLPNRRF